MAWIPNNFDTFREHYYRGASDFELASMFPNGTPDKVGKFLSYAVAEGMLERRVSFRHLVNDVGQIPQNVLDAVEIAISSTDLPKPYKGNKDNTLIIGDTHEPFSKKGYLEFCREVQERFDCGHVVHIGDEVDNCAMSYHETDPDGFSAGTEADLAQRGLNRWFTVFPEVDAIIGNHSCLHFRKAFTGGIPRRFLKNYEEVWQAPAGWNWYVELEKNGVYYYHGTGTAGDRAALTKALNRRQSVVQGHIHTSAGVMFNSGPNDTIWGMQVGCGIDEDSYAMAYAKTNARKAIISCGVVLDRGRIPLIVHM